MASESFRKNLSDNYQKIIIGIVIVASAIAMAVFNSVEDGWSDVSHFYRNISEVVDGGLMPYSETRFEYPPFLLVFFLVPKMFSWNETSFCVAYSIFSLIFFILGLYFIKKILAHYDVDDKYPFLIYISTFVFATVFVLCRNDVFAATLVLATIWLYVEKKYWIASAVLAVGAMTKLYPAILILILVLPLLMNRKWKETLCSAGAFAGVCILVSLPFMIYDFNSAFDYLTYHSDRGIEIESLAGTILLIIDMIVPGTVVIMYDQFQSYNLYGDITGTFQTVFSILLIAAVLGFLVWFAHRIEDLSEEEQVKHCIGIGCAAILLIAVIFNKMFSAQYVIWFFTLLPLMFIPITEKEDRKFLTIVYLIAGIVFLLSVIMFMPLTREDPVGIVVTFLKNVAMIVLAAYLIVYFDKYSEPDRKSHSSPPVDSPFNRLGKFLHVFPYLEQRERTRTLESCFSIENFLIVPVERNVIRNRIALLDYGFQ